MNGDEKIRNLLKQNQEPQLDQNDMDAEYQNILKKIECRDTDPVQSQSHRLPTLAAIAATIAIVVASSGLYYKTNVDKENEEISQILLEASSFDDDSQDDVIYAYNQWVEFSELGE